MNRAALSLLNPQWSPELVTEFETAVAAIARLDAHISATSVGTAWSLRASWTGYASALQQQGFDMHETDVFSWATGVPLPRRTPPASHLDPYATFPDWLKALSQFDHHWQEQLPFTPTITDDFAKAPLLLRALEVSRQYACADRSIMPWLWLPLLLYRMGVTLCPLPSLIAGDKAMRLPRFPQDQILQRLLRQLTAAAIHSLGSLNIVESNRSKAVAAISTTHRPGRLVALCAALLHHPITSPERTATLLEMTLSGAGKLLERAAGLGVVVEISGRRSWRIYAMPDVAISLGLIPAPRGRPRKPVEPNASPRQIEDILFAFDREMAEFDARFGSRSGLS